MELISLALEGLQNLAEYAASYRFGQSALRQCDRALWVVEKCARWAVPPPLDQDERPPPELVRPLPWVFFLMMLLFLRVAREAISLANLVMGKPPLRSADVVVFIQSRRRYLRTLKYQGSRLMRARTSAQPQRPWYSGIYSLFELTMCFRRQSHYGNNNTTRATNNDEVVVIKRPKRGRSENPAVTSGDTMERLIEKMMLDLDAESDEDSAITLTETDATSPKTDRSECTESDQDTVCETTPARAPDNEMSQTNGDDIHFSPNKNKHSCSTPEKQEKDIENDTGNHTFQISYVENDKTITENSSKNDEKRKLEQNVTEGAFTGYDTIANSAQHTESNVKEDDSVQNTDDNAKEDNTTDTVQNQEDNQNVEEEKLIEHNDTNTLSPSEESEKFIKNEVAASNSRKSKKEHKIANGRTVKSVTSKKKGANHQQRQSSNEVLPQRVQPSNSSY